MTTEEINALAHEIAEETAKSDIECHTIPRVVNGVRYWNTASADADDYHHVRTAMEYLEARGLLIREPGRPYLVRWEQEA